MPGHRLISSAQQRLAVSKTSASLNGIRGLSLDLQIGLLRVGRTPCRPTDLDPQNRPDSNRLKPQKRQKTLVDAQGSVKWPIPSIVDIQGRRRHTMNH